MEDLLKAMVDLATDPEKGIVALTWLVMANTTFGVVLALLRKEFRMDRLLDFLGGERVLLGGVVLMFTYAGIRVGLPLQPFYAFVAGAIAVSAVGDILAKVASVIARQP